MLRRSGVLKRKAEDAGPSRGSNAKANFPSELEEIKKSKLPEAVPQESPKRNFGDLPAEAVFMVFKYLDTNVIASSVLPVCKTWYKVGRDPILWKEVQMKGGSSTSSLANSRIAVVQRARLLGTLILSNIAEVSNILECVAKSCPLLSTLDLKYCTVNCASTVQLLVSSCPCLKRLRLDRVFGSAFKEFAELTALVDLQVAGQMGMGDFLMRLSQNSRQLESVTLPTSNEYNDEQLVPLLTNLKSVIKRLLLSPSRCGSPTYQAVAECSNLQSVQLIFPENFFDPDLNAMEKLKKLESIHIEHSSYGVQGISSIAWKSFISNVCSDHIEYVCFYRCNNVDLILEEVLSSRNDTILHRAKTVQLQHTGTISDHVVELILTHNPFLETLNLYDNSGFKGLAFNTTDTSFAPALRYLHLGKCYQVRRRYLRMFLKNRPSLKIIGPNKMVVEP